VIRIHIRILDGQLGGDPIVDRGVECFCGDSDGLVSEGSTGVVIIPAFGGSAAVPSLGPLGLNIVGVEGEDVETEMGAHGT
jgi:hypothetical protein